MVQEIKQAIVDNLLTILPDADIYDEDIHQGFRTPSFFISTYDQDYTKKIGHNLSNVSFDIAYFPDSEYPNNEIADIRVKLMREFDLIGTYRVLDKNCTMEDKVLHFMFKVMYREKVVTDDTKMVKLQTSINVKE